MPEAAFILWLHYAEGLDDLWRRRADLFRDHVLPRLRAQTIPADIWLWVHPRHEAEARTWGVDLFTVDDPPTAHHVPVKRWREAHGLPRYPVQLLMGSDDLIGPEYVATSLRELARISEPHAIVTFQPQKYDLATGRVYDTAPYGETYLSPFVAMRQPVDDPRYSWVWAMGHTKLHHLVDAVRVVPAGNCLLTIHGRNHSSALAENDRPAEAPAWLA